MRVLMVSAVYPPEPVVSSRTSAQIAEALLGEGHEVTVVCPFPSRPAGEGYPGFRRRWVHCENGSDGVKVVRCFSFYSRSSTLWSRFLENCSFGLSAGWVVLTGRRPDVIYSNAWPIFATGLVALVARLRGVPLVLSVQDVYPESLVSQGRIREGGVLARRMRWVDRGIARRSRTLIVLSERWAGLYQNGREVPSSRISVIPNWFEGGAIDHLVGQAPGRALMGIPGDAFVLAYGGNVGVAAGVETVIEAFSLLKEKRNLYLVIAGEGSRLEACRERAKQIDPKRILFRSPWPQEETSLILGSADILVLPTQGRQSLASVPSKLVAYMLAERPVLALAEEESDLAEVIRRAGCGWVVPPDQPQRLADRIREVIRSPYSDLKVRGSAGRVFALARFTSEACLTRVVELLENAILPCDNDNGMMDEEVEVRLGTLKE